MGAKRPSVEGLYCDRMIGAHQQVVVVTGAAQVVTTGVHDRAPVPPPPTLPVYPVRVHPPVDVHTGALVDDVHVVPAPAPAPGAAAVGAADVKAPGTDPARGSAAALIDEESIVPEVIAAAKAPPVKASKAQSAKIFLIIFSSVGVVKACLRAAGSQYGPFLPFLRSG